MLGDAKLTLENAFKSLSADALAHNNQSFLDLARASLAEFQQGAKGDLEKRQIAIDALVGPVKASLEKVDEKIHALEKAREQAYGEIRQQFTQMARPRSSCAPRPQPGEGAAPAARARALGRGPVEARGRDGGHARARRFRRAGVRRERRGPHVRPDLIVKLPGGAPDRGRLEGADQRVPRRARGAGRGGAQAKIRDHARRRARPPCGAGEEELLGAVRADARGRRDVHPGRGLLQRGARVRSGAPRHGLRPERDHRVTRVAHGDLKAAAYGWRQESHRARTPRDQPAGRRSCTARLGVMVEHFSTPGQASARDRELQRGHRRRSRRRVLVSARKFKELGATSRRRGYRAATCRWRRDPCPLQVVDKKQALERNRQRRRRVGDPGARLGMRHRNA